MTIQSAHGWTPIADPAPALSRTTRRPLRSPSPASPLYIAGLLCLIVVLNLADLIFTLSAHTAGVLHELNPLAQAMFSTQGVLDVILMKAAAVSVGCCILWRLRDCRWTLAACWLLVAVYLALACAWVFWGVSYQQVMQTRVEWTALATR